MPNDEQYIPLLVAKNNNWVDVDELLERSAEWKNVQLEHIQDLTVCIKTLM